MRKVFSILFAMFIASSISAQSDSDTTDFFTGKTLLFKFNGLSNLSLSNFNGGIGLKRRSWLFDGAFSRSSVDFQYSNSTQTASSYPVYRFEAVNIIEDIIYDFRRRKDIRPYLGFGIKTGYSIMKEEYERPEIHRYDEIRSLNLSGRGIVGFEYFWKENITFSAEYLIEGSFDYGENLSDYLNKLDGLYYHYPKGYSRRYGLSLDTISFILSVYF